MYEGKNRDETVKRCEWLDRENIRNKWDQDVDTTYTQERGVYTRRLLISQ